MTDFRELIYRGVESDVLDYKAPVDWNLLTKQQKAKFVRHALAFANTNGGAIVIGVREDINGHPSLYEGLNDQQCHSFDPSTVTTYINSHVDPAIDITVERPEIDGKRYAILVIKPFSDIPHVSLHSIDDELQNGVFYIRTASASSRPASRAGEMHDLVRRALRNQRDLLGNLLRDVLGEQHPANKYPEYSEQDTFPPEYSESCNFFSKRINSKYPAGTPVLDIAVIPSDYASKQPLALADLRDACHNILGVIPNGKMLLQNADMIDSYVTNVSLRGISRSRDRFWQLFQNGLMHFRSVLPAQLDYQDFKTQLQNFFELAYALYSQKIFAAQDLECQLIIEHSKNMQMLLTGEKVVDTAVCRINEIKLNEKINLQNPPQEFIKKLMNELAVRFNAPPAHGK